MLVFFFHRLYLSKIKGDTLIMDRYFYDTLADVADGRQWSFVQMFLRLVPKPDLQVFVEVSPEKAFARKGEYSVDYLAKRRCKYHQIFSWVDDPVILSNDDLEEAREGLRGAVSSRIYRL